MATKFELVERIEKFTGPTTGLWHASKDSLEAILASLMTYGERRDNGHSNVKPEAGAYHGNQ